MWGFQLHFQVAIKVAAEDLFKALHPDLEVEVFLLGLARVDANDVHPVCLEPEDCGFFPSEFEQVRSDAEHYRAIDPDRNILCGHPAHQASYDRRIEARAYQKAVLSTLNEHNFNRPGEYYFSGFVAVEKHDVGIVLRLNSRTKEKPYRLPRVHAEDRYCAPHSLVEAAARVFLFECVDSLRSSTPELVAEYRGPKTQELLREAGDRLMTTPVWAGGDGTFMYGLFGACNYIAELTYESEASIGKMLIAAAEHENVERTITLKTPIGLGEYRGVRKLLQIAAAGDALICDGSKVIGFGRVRGNYNQGASDLFEVRFTRHHHWELLHGGHSMMRVSYGTPSLPRPALNVEKLASDLGRIFPSLRADRIENLVSLATSACEQRHGALLVISSDAESEAVRLARQSTLIEPVILTESMVRAVTSVDGAVLLAPDGTCFSIGVILDGLATPNGDPARGARFNSSVRYIGAKTNCVAIIVSEDGTVEWVPNLRPQLSRAKLAQIEQAVKGQLAAAEIDLDEARVALNWLRENRFYLSEDLCKAANELKRRYDKRTSVEGGFVIHDEPFVPLKEMSADYLTE